MNTPHCAICGRKLSDPVSVRRGIGPICNAKTLIAYAMQQEKGVEDDYLAEFPPFANGFIFERSEDDTVRTNLPHAVNYHSDGFEWGYGGCGPAETSLNVLEYVVNREKLDTKMVTLYNKVRCRSAAWENHQEFKWEFIAPLSQDAPSKGVIPYATVVEWLTTKIAKTEEVYEQTSFDFEF